MTRYRVRWEIGVEADAPFDAARAAREAQIRPDTTATCFDVLQHPGRDEDRIVAIDLGGPGETPSVNGRPRPSSATAEEVLAAVEVTR